MSNENINFKKTFISPYTSNNISSSQINEKGNSELQSIFKIFDGNQDNQIDIQELQELIKKLDKNGDETLTKDEISSFAKNNGINKRMLSNFVTRIYDILPKADSDKTFKGNTPAKKEIRSGDIDLNYTLTSTKHGDYEKFTSTTKSNDSKYVPYKNSAIYNIKNDSLLPANNGNSFEIKGLQKFLEKKDSNNPPYPQLIIKGEDGKFKAIELRMNVNLNVNDKETYYKVLMTDLTDAISKLEPNVLQDLADNIKHIDIKILSSNEEKYVTDGILQPHNDNSNDYSESIGLNYLTGFDDLKEVLTHEIGHAVDANVKGFSTETNEKLKDFVSKLKELPQFKDIYALENPKEFYAEYYSYKNGGSYKEDTKVLFEALEKAPNDYGWNDEIINILDNIETVSNQMTADFINEEKIKSDKEAKLLNSLAEIDNKEDNQTKKILESISDAEIYNEIFNHISQDKISEILKKYPSLDKKYSMAESIEQKGNILKKIRNDKDFSEAFKKVSKKLGDLKSYINLDYEKALVELEKKTTNSCSQAIKKDPLSKKIDNYGLEKLIATEGFQEAIQAIIEKTDSVPEAIRERCINRQIDKELILRLRNQEDMHSFLAFQSGLYKTN